nr:rhomboid family intramembrane serine protease [Schaalia cardiffensis]
MLPSVERLFLFSPAFAAIQPWRFLTTAFLHSGIVHLLLNMLALYWVGSPLEKIFGHWRFAAIYLLSAIGGSAFVLMWVLVQPSTVYTATVGASGAVFGLFGALFVVQREAGMDTRAVLVLVAANLAYGFIASNVSWQSHLGGLIVGAFVAFLLIRQGRAKGGITAREQESQAMLMTGAVFLGMCAFITLIYKVLFGVLS